VRAIASVLAAALLTVGLALNGRGDAPG